jgi:hypothetical protein
MLPPMTFQSNVDVVVADSGRHYARAVVEQTRSQDVIVSHRAPKSPALCAGFLLWANMWTARLVEGQQRGAGRHHLSEQLMALRLPVGAALAGSSRPDDRGPNWAAAGQGALCAEATWEDDERLSDCTPMRTKRRRVDIDR